MEILKVNRMFLSMMAIPVNGKNFGKDVFYGMVSIICIYTLGAQLRLTLLNFDQANILVDVLSKLIEIFMGFSRSVCYFYYRKTIVKTYKAFADNHNEVKAGPYYAQYIRWIQYAESFSRFYAWVFFVSPIFYGFFPIMLNLREMLDCSCFSMLDYPFNGLFPITNIPFWQFLIAYIFIVFDMIFFCGLVVAVDTTFCCSVLAIVGNMRVLTEYIKAADELQSEEEAVKALVKVIDKQNEIYEIIDDVQAINSVALLIKFCTVGATICLALLNLIINKDDSNSIRNALFLLAPMQLFFSALCGTLLMIEGEALAEAIYEAKWYEKSLSLRKMYLLLLLRAQKPLAIRAFYMSGCDLEIIKKTFTVSTSFYALMKSVIKE